MLFCVLVICMTPNLPAEWKGISLDYNWQTLQGRETPWKKNGPDCEHGPALRKLTETRVQGVEPRCTV